MKAKYCSNCGAELKNNSKFCTNCGNKITNKKVSELNKKPQNRKLDLKSKEDNSLLLIDKINKKIDLKNNQTGIVKRTWIAAAIFLVLSILPFQEWSPVTGAWALAFISFFLFLVALVIGFMFRSREKKLQKLIDGDAVLVHWHLTPEQKKHYVQHLFKHEAGKNTVILFSISVIAIVVFGIFILVIDQGKLFMLAVLVGLIAFLASFAYGMPYYYRYKNSKGDGEILIGNKYAYVNGYFHNWDFPLSGIKKAKIIKEPFYGLNLVYYYTDRTLSHSEELFIPANEDIDLEKIIIQLKEK